MAQTDYQVTGVLGIDLYRVDSTVPTQPLGTTVHGLSATYGGATFRYLKGVASVVEGTVVTYDSAFATTRLAANAIADVAVALGPVVANTWGWFQIGGKAAALCAASSAADVKIGYESAAGTIGDGFADGDCIYGAVSRSATDTPISGMCWIQLDGAPYVNDKADLIE